MENNASSQPRRCDQGVSNVGFDFRQAWPRPSARSGAARLSCRLSRDQVNHCPGCGRSHWYIGRLSAECGFCGTALPLTEADDRRRPVPPPSRAGRGRRHGSLGPLLRPRRRGALALFVSIAIDAAFRGPAGVAELVDAPGLGPGIERCGGSSPFARTSFRRPDRNKAAILTRRFESEMQDCRDVERRPEARLPDHHSRQGHRRAGSSRS